jgi:8-oxo-dGTP pyrophosphatase MutT (NUDIX family)
VLPKGHVEKGHTLAEAAEHEAWEEAGLKGTADLQPLGDFNYEKNGDHYRVTVYRFTVSAEHPAWPERLHRDREWMLPEEAARRVAEPGLRAILMTLSASFPTELGAAIAG